MYLTVNNDLLDAGVLAVSLRKIDSGSGVREVDLYQIMPGIIIMLENTLIYNCMINQKWIMENVDVASELSFLCIMNFPGGNEVVPVVSGVKNDIVILPLSGETEFTFFSSSVDNVGNRRPLQSAVQDTVQLNFNSISPLCLPLVPTIAAIMGTVQYLETACVIIDSMEEIAVKVVNQNCK